MSYKDNYNFLDNTAGNIEYKSQFLQKALLKEIL